MSDAPHPTDVKVGRLLRERRLELGISQERLGALLGVTYQQVQKYERGTNRIGSSRLQDLCRILGVRASYFIDEPDTLPPPATGSARVRAGLEEHAQRPGFDLAGAPGREKIGREDQELLSAFHAIGDPEIRRRLVDLTRALARGMAYSGAGST